jgi:hypothetical protein
MKPEQQRIEIAKACGWELKSNGLSPMWSWQNESLTHRIKWVAHKEMASQGVLPDYLNDLNAMHEAIGTLLFSQRRAYRINLKEIMSKKINPAVICYSECIDAPAAQRAEAFLKTIDKWTTNTNND